MNLECKIKKKDAIKANAVDQKNKWMNLKSSSQHGATWKLKEKTKQKLYWWKQ